MKKNLEHRLNVLGYKLLSKFYSWSQWKIIVGPENPNFIIFCDTLQEVEKFVQTQEGLTSKV